MPVKTEHKIRCNNCMQRFKDDGELLRLYENADGTKTAIPKENDSVAIDGCPVCRTDAYLMDL